MCNACGHRCCDAELFDGCGCSDCEDPRCWPSAAVEPPIHREGSRSPESHAAPGGSVRRPGLNPVPGEMGARPADAAGEWRGGMPRPAADPGEPVRHQDLGAEPAGGSATRRILEALDSLFAQANAIVAQGRVPGASWWLEKARLYDLVSQRFADRGDRTAAESAERVATAARVRAAAERAGS